MIVLIGSLLCFIYMFITNEVSESAIWKVVELTKDY